MVKANDKTEKQNVDVSDEVVQFARAFVKAEYDALLARHTEPDDAKFRKKSTSVQKYLGRGVEIPLQRPIKTDDNWFNTGKEMVKYGTLAPRKIFQIKRYDNGSGGPLYRVYASSHTRPRRGGYPYGSSLFLREEGSRLEVISIYDLDILGQEGQHLKSDGLTWILASGDKVARLGEPSAVRKIEPPDHPEHRADYDRE